MLVNFVSESCMEVLILLQFFLMLTSEARHQGIQDASQRYVPARKSNAPSSVSDGWQKTFLDPFRPVLNKIYTIERIEEMNSQKKK